MARTSTTHKRVASRRASARVSIDLDLADRDLKDLMIEQCLDSGRHITVYQGSRAQLLRAGVPSEAFPDEGDEKAFQVRTVNACSSGKSEMLAGIIQRKGEVYELEVDWGYVVPYLQGGHPVLVELARMLLIDIGDYTRNPSAQRSNTPDLQWPFQFLADHPNARDYKPTANAPRWRVTPEFYERLCRLASEASALVHEFGEIVRVDLPQAPAPQAPRLRAVK